MGTLFGFIAGVLVDGDGNEPGPGALEVAAQLSDLSGNAERAVTSTKAVVSEVDCNQLSSVMEDVFEHYTNSIILPRLQMLLQTELENFVMDVASNLPDPDAGEIQIDSDRSDDDMTEPEQQSRMASSRDRAQQLLSDATLAGSWNDRNWDSFTDALSALPLSNQLELERKLSVLIDQGKVRLE